MGGCLCAHTGFHRGKEWRLSSHGLAQTKVCPRPCSLASCPSSPGDQGRCPSLPLSCSAYHLSTCVLPSPGGKQPVPVGLLWIQQAAFVSPNSETLQKATEWAGDCFLGREPQVSSTMVGRGSRIYAPGPMPACASFERHTHSQTTSIHANTYVCTHIRKSSRSTEFVTCILLCTAYSSFSWNRYVEMTDGWPPPECPHHRWQMALMHPTKATEQKQIEDMWDRWLARNSRICLVPGEYERTTVLYWEHLTPRVYMHNVYSRIDILDSSRDLLAGLSPFHYWNLHRNDKDFAGQFQTSVVTVVGNRCLLWG